MASSEAGLPVPAYLQRGLHESREEWLESGLFLVDLLCRTIGRDDLSEVDLLDVGCGTKIVKTLLDSSEPIEHYTGIDAAPEVINWLQANVSDPRFEFHLLDAHNELYNPEGEPLDSFELLPVGPRRFDLICLFSVFTHLAPDDFVAMLRLLRRHVRQDGMLLFSLFLKQPLSAADHGPGFIDEIPQRPLLRARYTREYALELLDGTGWEVETIHPPHPKGYIQHYMICHTSSPDAPQ
jgi:SAM-dependent methyltransferase